MGKGLISMKTQLIYVHNKTIYIDINNLGNEILLIDMDSYQS